MAQLLQARGGTAANGPAAGPARRPQVRVAVIGTGAFAVQIVPAIPASGRHDDRLPAHARLGAAAAPAAAMAKIGTTS